MENMGATWQDQPTATPRRGHFLLAALLWTAFAIYGSLVPLQFSFVPFDQAWAQFVSLPPLWFGLGTRADWVANILLFIPLTFLWIGGLACDRRSRVGLLSATVVVPLACAAAVSLEFTQLYFPGRTVSRNDIVAESLGAVLGAILWITCGPWATRALRSRFVVHSRTSRLTWVLHAYVLGLVWFSVVPLDLTISMTELYHKFRNGQVVIIPFSYAYSNASSAIYQLLADIALFVPVGAWAVLTFADPRESRHRVLIGTIGGWTLAILIEFAQLLVLSRYSDSTDVVLGLLGSFSGAYLVTRLDSAGVSPQPVQTRRAPAVLAGAIAAYTVVLVVGFLYPFDFTRDSDLIRARLGGVFRVPLLSLYWGSEFNALQQVAARILLFGILGGLWAGLAGVTTSRTWRSVVKWASVAYGAALAAGIELLQVAMPSRTADSTEILVCALGSLIGFQVTTWVADTRRGKDRLGRQDRSVKDDKAVG